LILDIFLDKRRYFDNLRLVQLRLRDQRKNESTGTVRGSQTLQKRPRT